MDGSLVGRVAIVTGAGGGLGRAHALALARCGARLMVNDLGAELDGGGGSMSRAQKVVEEIRTNGGEAIPNGASVTDPAQVGSMVQAAIDEWGRVDILVNNAGILRDRTFARLSLEDFRAVIEVHLMGSVNCTKAVWQLMRDQTYGRIVFTTSSSGLFGNFGQSHYAAAKMALVGLANTLRLEGARYGIHVNCLSPSAATRMTDDVMSPDDLANLAPEKVAPAVVALASEDAPNGVVLCAGGGSFERAYVTLTRGVVLGSGPDVPEAIISNMTAISDREGDLVPESGPMQAQFEIHQANGLQTAAEPIPEREQPFSALISSVRRTSFAR